jgi:hypothetical protein
VQRPAAVVAPRPTYGVDTGFEPFVGGRLDSGEVLQSPEHIEVPLGREREPCEGPVHDLTRAVR